MFFICKNLNTLHQRNLGEICTVVLEKIFKFSIFCYYFSLEKGVVLLWNKLEYLLHKYALVEIGPVFLKKMILKLFIRYYLSRGKGVALHFNKLEFPRPKDVLWPSGYREEDLERRKVYNKDGQLTFGSGELKMSKEY